MDLIAAIYLGSISLASLFYFITPSLIHAGFSSNAALVQSAQNLIAVPGLIVAGILADRFTGRKVAAAMLAGLGVASMLLMEAGSGSAAWPLYMVAFIVVFGLTAGVTAAVFPIALAELVGLKRFGTLAGLMSLASTFGMATGPLLVGRFFDLTGNYAMGFEVGAVLCLVSGAMTLMLVMAAGLEDVSPARISAPPPAIKQAGATARASARRLTERRWILNSASSASHVLFSGACGIVFALFRRGLLFSKEDNVKAYQLTRWQSEGEVREVAVPEPGTRTGPGQDWGRRRVSFGFAYDGISRPESALAAAVHLRT